MGPVTLSVNDIKIGISTILIVFFPNTLVILLFKYAGPKPDPNARKYELIEDEVEKGTFKLIFRKILKWTKSVVLRLL